MKEASKAHALLDYILTKCVVDQELTTSTIALDYTALSTECEDVYAIPEEVNNIKLKVKITLEWDLEDEMIDFEGLLTEEGDEDESDEGPTSDSGSQSH